MPPDADAGSCSSAMLVVSISSDVSGSGVTCSRSEAAGAGGDAGGADG